MTSLVLFLLDHLINYVVFTALMEPFPQMPTETMNFPDEIQPSSTSNVSYSDEIEKVC